MPRRPQPARVVPRNGDHPDIQPVGQSDWIRQALYSFPGHGKTSIVGSSAVAGPTLIIRSSMDPMPSGIIGKPGLDEFIADDWEHMLEIQQYCRMSQEFPYVWVWWDCASIAQDVLLDDVWSGTVAEKPGRAFLIDSNGRPGKPNLSPTSGLDKGEYGRNMERIQQWVRHMVGAKRFHFGITFHPMEGKHPTNDEAGTLLRPYVQGREMTEKLCGYMNIVSFLEIKEGDDQAWRRLHTRENERFYAKDAYDAFPKGYIDITKTSAPTIPRMMSTIEAARGKLLAGEWKRDATTTAAPRRGRREQ